MERKAKRKTLGECAKKGNERRVRQDKTRPRSPQPSVDYLQDLLIIEFIEDSPIDLVGFQSHPVEGRHTEFGLYWFLDSDSFQKKNKTVSIGQKKPTLYKISVFPAVP